MSFSGMARVSAIALCYDQFLISWRLRNEARAYMYLDVCVRVSTWMCACVYVRVTGYTENEYLMRCVTRLVSFGGAAVVPHAALVLSNTTALLSKV